MATNILVCLVLVAAASAVPIIRDDFDSASVSPPYKCAVQCSASQDKFNYQVGTTYIYEYKAEAETSVAGASEDKAKMYIETKAKIEVLDKCEFALRLQDVQVFHSKPESDTMKPAENVYEFQRALTANPLRFSFDEGVIRSVCHKYEEKIWVLNFKRGLLSAFQNSMDDLEKDQTVTEVDVTGECEAEYTKKTEWSWRRDIKLSKTKNLQACYHHSGMRTLVPMVPYKVDSEIQSLPIMKSSHHCDFVISSDRVLESAVCREDHVFAPFSNHQSGGATKVTQTLTFVSSRRGVETREANIEVRSNLLFKHMNGIDEVQNSKQIAEQKLMEICEQTKVDVRPESPRLFDEIARAVKDMDSADLQDLYNMIKDGSRCRHHEKAMKYLLDTLPIAGTKGALDLMVIVINNNDIPDAEKTMWFTSLSLIPEPTEDMIPSLMNLLDTAYASQALLPVSALLNTMCSKNVDCEHSYSFKRIVDKINNNIDSSCSSNEKEQILRTLRAIGNTGYGREFLKTLKTCMTSRYTPLEVKVVAADAWRRFECQDDEESGVLMETFEATNADSELRIRAFLSLMRCPRDTVLQKIAEQLNREEDVNVGTFVWSHLENLKKTSDPHKQDLAEAIKHLDLKPFEDGGFRTSRCHESSALINRLNLGYVADADLLWSPNSMMPRAMSVNLTVAMFGNSINFFEAGARMDGVDRFVQKYFGTESYFTQNEASPDDLEAFIYARMFGNELYFKHMKGSEEYEKIKSSLRLDNLLDKMSREYDFKYTHSQQLMDQSLIIPTAIGLPVNMTVNSSVIVNTETKGEIDFGGILSRSRPISITNNLIASAGLEVTGSMMVDAMLYKQGARMRNTLHSSVNVRASLKVMDKKIVDLEIDSPEERQEIFDARSQFFIVHDNYEKEQEMIKENRREMEGCTGDKFAQVTGVELCGKLEYPNASMVEDAPYFPLTGPVRASLVLNKKDTHRSYKIFAKWVKNSRKLEAQLQLDTPGSQVDRHISADLTIGTHKNSHVDFIFISPWKKIVLNSKGARTNEITSLTGDLLIDDSKQYKLTSEMKMQDVRRGIEVQPFVHIENGMESITLLKGTLNYASDVVAKFELQDFEQNKYTMDGLFINNSEEKRIDVSAGKKGDKPYRVRIGSAYRVSGRQDKNIEVDPEFLIQTPEKDIVSFKSYGEIRSQPTKVAGNMTFSTDMIRMKRPVTLEFDVHERNQRYPVTGKLQFSRTIVKLNGEVDVGKNIPKADMTLTYKTGQKKEVITFTGKLQDKCKPAHCKYIVKSHLTFKTMPEYNTDSVVKINKKKSMMNVDVDVKFTDKPQTSEKRRQPGIQLHFSSDTKSMKQAEIKADLMAYMPEEDVDMRMKFNHEHSWNKKKLESTLKLHFDPLDENDINADISIEDKGKNLYDVTAVGNLDARGKKYNMKSELVQKSRRRFEHSITISEDRQEKHSMVTVYKNTNDRYEINADIESSSLDHPVGIEVSADYKKPTDFHIRGAVNENNDVLYSVDALSKLEDSKAGKWNLEVAYPERKVKAQVDFTKADNRMDIDAVVNWDVGSRHRPAPEVRMTTQLTHVTDSESLLLKTNVKLFTPFESYEKLTLNWNLEKSERDLKSTGKISYDDRLQFTSRLDAKLPISMEKADVSFQAQTPFEDYKEIKVELDHKFDDKIKTHLKAKLNNDVSEVVIRGAKDVNYSSRKINGKVIVKTPYQSYKRVEMEIDYNDNANEISTVAQIDKDGDKYNVDFKYSKEDRRSKTERSGKLEITGPEISAVTTFTHKTEDGKQWVEAAFVSGSGRNRYSADVNGFYEKLSHHSLKFNMKTPYRLPSEIELDIDNMFEKNQLKSSIIFGLNSVRTGYDIKLKNHPEDKSAEIEISAGPLFAFEHPLHVKSNLRCKDYPFTVSGQIGWSPSSIIGFTGSYKAPSVDDMDINVKLTTPFEKLENIVVVASSTLRNSVRTSHLNVDYGMRKMVDIEVSSQNDESRKALRAKVSIPSDQFKSLETGVSVDLRRGVFAKADIELKMNHEEKYEGAMSLKVNGVDNIRGKMTMRTPVEGFEEIECTLTIDGRREDKTSSLILTSSGEKLIDVEAETEVKRNRVDIKVIVQGKLLPHIMEVIDDLRVLPQRFREDRNGNEIKRLITELRVEEEGRAVQIDGSLIPDFGRSQDKLSATIRITGDQMKDIDVYVSLEHNSDKVTGHLVLKLDRDVQVTALVTARGEKHGIEYIQSGNTYKGALYLHELRKFEVGAELFVSDIKLVEFVMTAKSDIANYELLKVKYTHEGQDNRVSTSISVEDVKGIKASMDFVAQTSPVHRFSLIVKTPFRDYNNMVVSGDYDHTKFNALMQLNDGKRISLTGSHDDWKNPKLTLKTPLRQLQVLTVNVDGVMWDGSFSFTWKLNDYDQIEGNVAMKYESMSVVEIIANVKPRVNQVENDLVLEVKMTARPRMTHVLVSVNDKDKIKFDSQTLESIPGRDKSERVDFEMWYPSMKAETRGLVVNWDKSDKKVSGKIEVYSQTDKIVDAEFDVEMSRDTKASLIVRQPKHMEYRFTRENFPNANENEFYFNWDRSNPESNLRIKASQKDEVTSSKMIKEMKLRLSCPHRSVGVEHSLIATSTNVQSSGKIYLGDDKESQLSYEMELKDESDRRETSREGRLQVQLPARTVGISGYAKDNSDEREAGATLCWDLERDARKKIGMKAKLQKGAHVQADVSIIFPEDAHVDSKLVMNKGNTILEGKTQIFYSDDDRKTLTLFSKLENNPGHSSLFYSSDTKYNYSIQVGVSHPDSRVDVKMASHLGLDSERLTTSVGLDYLTSRRQMKNVDLFMEINKLKKEINLQATSPYKNIGAKGSISHNPMELKAVTTVDGEQTFSSSLLMDQTQKKAHMSFATQDKEVRYSASIPNRTAVLFQREEQTNGRVERNSNIKLLIQLSTPHLLKTDLQWNPGMPRAFRDRMFEIAKQHVNGLKALSDEILDDVKREAEAKYRDIKESVMDDLQRIVRSIDKEIATLEGDTDRVMRNLREDFDFCSDIGVGEFKLEKEIALLHKKLRDVVGKMRTFVKAHTQSYRDSLRIVSEKLDELKSTPFEELYEKIMQEISWIENRVFNTFVLDFLKALKSLSPETLAKLLELLQDMLERQYDPSILISQANQKMEEFKNVKLTSLVAKMSERQLQIVSKLKIILTKLSSFVSQMPITEQVIDLVEEHANELYQLARWSINYWEIENNLPQQLDKLIDYLVEIIEEELSESMGPVYRYIRNPVTKFDPSQGVLQAEFPLVIPVQRLDTIPSALDFSKTVAQHVETKIGTNKSETPSRTPYPYSSRFPQEQDQPQAPNPPTSSSWFPF